MTAARWTMIYAALATLMLGVLAFLVWAVPIEDGIREWTGQLIPGFWMAWTFPVALFFWCIAGLLIIMTLYSTSKKFIVSVTKFFKLLVHKVLAI